ncbi:MAG: hypothetical protein AVDCRST_MAG93-1606 [uncultured Chloroflexia bacterium]|uniref:Uncharacterized protein n=1 Tax=uncultured Chloroflexia bacterium TaxID=1672391 RepID=A0A6J4IDG8_9CHLR|nr:MAG: hypothetical protein AVDCRST_MAG93-1606 [uncultured Chloroflexia bacterium]
MGETREMCIYVALLNEGVDVWRPVKAMHQGMDVYKIVSQNPAPDDETWEFQHGDCVRCEVRTSASGETRLTAVARADDCQ